MLLMKPEERVRYIQSWGDSRFSWKRMTFYSLKYIVVKQIYQEPDLLDHIGYGRSMRERMEGRCSSMAQR
jgi:hypothetical protein